MGRGVDKVSVQLKKIQHYKNKIYNIIRIKETHKTQKLEGTGYLWYLKKMEFTTWGSRYVPMRIRQNWIWTFDPKKTEGLFWQTRRRHNIKERFNEVFVEKSFQCWWGVNFANILWTAFVLKILEAFFGAPFLAQMCLKYSNRHKYLMLFLFCFKQNYNVKFQRKCWWNRLAHFQTSAKCLPPLCFAPFAWSNLLLSRIQTLGGP